MAKILPVSVATAVLALWLALGAPAPVEGIWEGRLHGVKAVTLTVRENGQTIEGSIVFYIVRDNGSGRHDGEATAALALAKVTWDGRILRFSVTPPEGESRQFEMKLTGERSAELKRVETITEPELTLAMARQ